ncbi:MAG: bifunctional phosphopantothenoylcysteine decarboxylase/phosphopantothenate--cysteine ligase CoaBC [Clostridia bacterium]|nr:bifunctional phosphopantothenoylcysteine decarboxylase/phosphopantothenate--cysteine ligase CoaBC [Clostridia bacterium]
MLTGKTVVLGVSGSIAAYKAASLASMLKKAGCDVFVIMTRNATNFIHPITFETITQNKCLIDTFDRNFKYDVEHVSLAKKADLFLVAPASADIIAKMAHGIADDMLTTTALACKCKKIVAPAMNTNMLENAIVIDNISLLKRYGFEIAEPEVGRLACGDVGSGKLPSEDVLFDYVMKAVAYEKDLNGVKVLVTAGPTKEAIDPVRYITNHSTGKMGYALAKAAMLRGADVTLVSGQTYLAKPRFVDVVEVESAEDMFSAVVERSGRQDIIIKAAAVADYTPLCISGEKIKKSDAQMCISLKRTKDILFHLGKNKKDGQFLCGFSMETQNMLENSRKKLLEKNADMIVANDLKVDGAGFAGDTNVLTIITKNRQVSLEKMSKDKAAHKVLDAILAEKNMS